MTAINSLTSVEQSLLELRGLITTHGRPTEDGGVALLPPQSEDRFTFDPVADEFEAVVYDDNMGDDSDIGRDAGLDTATMSCMALRFNGRLAVLSACVGFSGNGRSMTRGRAIRGAALANFANSILSSCQADLEAEIS